MIITISRIININRTIKINRTNTTKSVKFSAAFSQRKIIPKLPSIAKQFLTILINKLKYVKFDYSITVGENLIL